MKTALLILLGLCVAASADASKTLEVNRLPSKVEFLAIGNPSALKIKGRSEAANPIEGTLKKTGNRVGGVFSFPLDTIDTGIALRNRHMKEKYLHTEKHPKAQFTLEEMELPTDSATFKGSMTLHGVTKQVTGTLRSVSEGTDRRLEFRFQLALDEFAIEPPSFMGITVAKTVDVSVDLGGVAFD